MIDENIVTKAIATRFFHKFLDSVELDVAIVGAGPSGLTCAWRLAAQGFKVAVFERKLSLGGGMWGGGMTWNEIVVQEESRHVLDEAGVPVFEFAPGYFTADAVAASVTLASKACLAGARIFNCMSVEDVCMRGEGEDVRVTGIVVNSSPVEMAGLHVDPLALSCTYLIEATGHAMEVLHTLTRKNGVRLKTPTGEVMGERSMWADTAERTTPENTREVFPGVWVAGMAANACFGGYRMGPVFGGMLLSGEKAAREIAAKLRG
ncbi:thiazole biosynthetic enzyme [Desulfovibrio sp. X2]|nr:thiazole biosynthetic enzyme [Desulfovibrio sp. X2]